MLATEIHHEIHNPILTSHLYYFRGLSPFDFPRFRIMGLGVSYERHSFIPRYLPLDFSKGDRNKTKTLKFLNCILKYATYT